MARDYADEDRRHLLGQILVRRMPNGSYSVVDGDDRLSAAKLAGRQTISVLVTTCPAKDVPMEAFKRNKNPARGLFDPGSRPVEQAIIRNNPFLKRGLCDGSISLREAAEAVGAGPNSITTARNLFLAEDRNEILGDAVPVVSHPEPKPTVQTKEKSKRKPSEAKLVSKGDPIDPELRSKMELLVATTGELSKALEVSPDKVLENFSAFAPQIAATLNGNTASDTTICRKAIITIVKQPMEPA